MNNPFKPVPQRPYRDDPERDRLRDPLFHKLFVQPEQRRGY